jgi:hypothetical protein
MFKQILDWFIQSSQQSALEAFINSKNPTSPAEVDYWTREYDRKNYVWGRGL